MKVNLGETQKGITLIALVITIIVLLILAGISIAMLTGENGVLTQAQNSKKETTIGEEKEQIQLAYTAAKMKSVEESVLKADLQQELDTIVGVEKTEVDNNDDGSFNVKFKETKNNYNVTNEEVKKTAATIRNKEIIVTESTQDITFRNTITLEDVKTITEKEGSTYEIIGISFEEDGTYGVSAEGNTGILEIQGEKNDATFKYTLNKAMNGDEVFFVEYTIDGVEQPKQRLKVIQGDVITYQEDFVGFEYIGEWVDDVNENYSGGKAKKATYVDSNNFSRAIFKAKTYKYDVITKSDDIAGRIKLLMYDNNDDAIKLVYMDMKGKGEGDIEYNAIVTIEDEQKADKLIITAMQGTGGKTTYLDAVKVYK